MRFSQFDFDVITTPEPPDPPRQQHPTSADQPVPTVQTTPTNAQTPPPPRSTL
jgi:hypothetical protein